MEQNGSFAAHNFIHSSFLVYQAIYLSSRVNLIARSFEAQCTAPLEGLAKKEAGSKNYF